MTIICCQLHLARSLSDIDVSTASNQYLYYLQNNRVIVVWHQRTGRSLFKQFPQAHFLWSSLVERTVVCPKC